MSQKLVGILTMVTLLVSGCTESQVAAAAVPACRSRVPKRPWPSQGGPSRALSQSPGRVLAGRAATDIASARAGSQFAPIPGERKLIRKGEMTLEVRSIATALATLGQIMISVGGQTTNQLERQNEYGGRTASITCRVPADRLDEAIEAVRALGQSRALTFTAEDVTADYFDVTVRINTQKALEGQLVGLLQRASNRLADLLEIERELARVREEIDRMEGRVRWWDNQVALSSLVITLEEPAPIVAGTGGGPLRTLAESFNEAAENFVLAAAGIIAATGSILPMALLFGVVALMVVIVWRRRRPPVAPAM